MMLKDEEKDRSNDKAINNAMKLTEYLKTENEKLLNINKLKDS
jgi:hypothetical protein